MEQKQTNSPIIGYKKGYRRARVNCVCTRTLLYTYVRGYFVCAYFYHLYSILLLLLLLYYITYYVLKQYTATIPKEQTRHNTIFFIIVTTKEKRAFRLLYILYIVYIIYITFGESIRSLLTNILIDSKYGESSGSPLPLFCRYERGGEASIWRVLRSPITSLYSMAGMAALAALAVSAVLAVLAGSAVLAVLHGSARFSCFSFFFLL